MHTVSAALPHAAGWHGLSMPRQQTTASVCTRAISETRTQADISLMTAEGDKVTLSVSSLLQAAYASYDARGRLAGQQLGFQADAWQLATSHQTAIGVEGALNDAERADINHLLETLGAGAAAPQTRLAGHLLWQFAHRLEALAAEQA